MRSVCSNNGVHIKFQISFSCMIYISRPNLLSKPQGRAALRTQEERLSRSDPIASQADVARLVPQLLPGLDRSLPPPPPPPRAPPFRRQEDEERDEVVLKQRRRGILDSKGAVRYWLCRLCENRSRDVATL